MQDFDKIKGGGGCSFTKNNNLSNIHEILL